MVGIRSNSYPQLIHRHARARGTGEWGTEMGTGHIYVTMHGEFTGAWAGEFAQMGFRFGIFPLGTSQGPIRPLHDLGAPTQTFNTYDTTHFNVVESFTSDTPGVPIAWSEYLDDCAADVWTFLNTVKSYQSTAFRWTHLKFSAVELGTGRVRVPGTIYTLKTPLSGGAANMLPPEVSIALSMRAGIVGRRGRGRMYLPAVASTTNDNSGKVVAGNRTALANATAALITAINDQPGLDTLQTRVIVTSAAATDCVLPTEVRVGDHFDAQRRRQHQVDEVYTTVSV